MPGKKGNLLVARCIVEPNTDTTCHRETSAIGRILYLIYPAFAEPRFGSFGEVPLGRILGEGAEGK